LTLVFFNFDDGLAFVCATLGAHAMRNMVFAARFAHDEMLERKLIMRLTLAATAA
jgi:hypothetical protein